MHRHKHVSRKYTARGEGVCALIIGNGGAHLEDQCAMVRPAHLCAIMVQKYPQYPQQALHLIRIIEQRPSCLPLCKILY